MMAARTGTEISRQRGLALPMSLILLLVLMLSSAALVRTVDTAVLVSGNIAFKQSASLATERGVRAATNWLTTTTPVQRQNDDATQGYCTRMHILDVNRDSDDSQQGWDPTLPTNSGTQNGWHTGCTTPNNVVPVSLPADNAGNTVEYMIHRLCRWGDGVTSDPGLTLWNGVQVNQSCSTAASRSACNRAASSRRSGAPCIGTASRTVAYRITVRAIGPRNAQSVTQTTVLLAE